MQRAADRVAFELAEIQRLLHDAFAGKRRVAVNQKHHAALAFVVACPILLRAHAPERDGIRQIPDGSGLKQSDRWILRPDCVSQSLL